MLKTQNQQSFETFMSQLKKTNQTLGFFCDFDKITKNVHKIESNLCKLNSLIGTTDLRKSVEAIWKNDKTAFSVMDILVANRKKSKKLFLDSAGNCLRVDSLFNTVDGVVEFLEKTGLADLFQSKKIINLSDYVLGIETGLDSNARKNRSGDLMEDTVAEIFDSKGISYRKEVYSSEWPEISKVLGNDKKRFDFVITSSNITYLIEVNFYSGSGSKLNEVARSYSDIAPKINSVPGFKFIWITDGIGWKKAKNKLQEAYCIIPDIYNLTSVQNFISEL